MKTIAAIISMFIATASHATGNEGGNRHREGGKQEPANVTQSVGVSVKQSARAEARAQAKASARSSSSATGGNGTGGNAAGGAGGAAINGGQTQVFSPVIGWGAGLGGSGATVIKNVAEPPAPSMPAVTHCTTGWSSGVGWSGFTIGGGGYYKDLLCQWERLHAVAVASNDDQGAKDIRHGMLMMTCEDTPPERRKFFKQCDELPKQKPQEIQNAAFSSAG